MVIWKPAYVGEKKLLRFFFDNQLQQGEVVQSVDITITDLAAKDLNPDNIKYAPAKVSGYIALQYVTNLVADAEYYITCFANTDRGRHLVDAVLPVKAPTGI